MTLLPWKRTVRARGPQTTGFEDLALPLLPSLYNIAFWLSRNPADAEDLVQETFLKALRGFPNFEPGSNFRAWIFRILRNTYLTSRTGLAAMRTVALEDELAGDNESGPYPEGTINRETPEMNLIRLGDRAAPAAKRIAAEYDCGQCGDFQADPSVRAGASKPRGVEEAGRNGRLTSEAPAREA